MQRKSPPTLLERLYSFWLMGAVAGLFVTALAFFALRSPDGPQQVWEEAAAGAPAPAESKAGSLFTPAPIPFDGANAEHLLCVFPLQGVTLVGDAAPLMTLLPPGSELNAQLIRRDASPVVESDGYTMRFRLDAPYVAPGVNGAAAAGELQAAEGGQYFSSGGIPVMPVFRDGIYDAYPTAFVTAGKEGGEPAAATRVVLPVSTQVGCRNCHTGAWKTDEAGGISVTTAMDILALHDRYNKTEFVEETAEGDTIDCASCHTGGDTPTLSAAIHGFHAVTKLSGDEACASCHASGEDGQTRFYRGLHADMGLDCTRCHGTMAEHAASLLRREIDLGNKGAQKRLDALALLLAEPAAAIFPREPYVNMPQCAGCHDFTEKPDAGTASAFNKWTDKAEERFSRAYDDTGQLRCPSCHGPAHALYPAQNERDNIQPLQYQNAAAPLGANGNCAACHTVPVDDFVHHGRVE